jgi:hypothetical protein
MSSQKSYVRHRVQRIYYGLEPIVGQVSARLQPAIVVGGSRAFISSPRAVN